MNKIVMNTSALCVGAVMVSMAGTAGAVMVTDPVALSIENVNGPVSYYRSVSFFPVTPEGEPLSSGAFETAITPVIYLGDVLDNVVRPYESFTFMDDLGNPGTSILKIDFGTVQPWSPGEMLTFTFSLNYEEGTPYEIDAQFTLLPSPGAALLMAGAGLFGLRRRRN